MREHWLASSQWHPGDDIPLCGTVTVGLRRTGNCYDNAVMESFFGTLKTELVHHEAYATREEARQSLFEYIEVFYNRQRHHSVLGYKSPYEFEVSLN